MAAQAGYAQDGHCAAYWGVLASVASVDLTGYEIVHVSERVVTGARWFDAFGDRTFKEGGPSEVGFTLQREAALWIRPSAAQSARRWTKCRHRREPNSVRCNVCAFFNRLTIE